MTVSKRGSCWLSHSERAGLAKRLPPRFGRWPAPGSPSSGSRAGPPVPSSWHPWSSVAFGPRPGTARRFAPRFRSGARAPRRLRSADGGGRGIRLPSVRSLGIGTPAAHGISNTSPEAGSARGGEFRFVVTDCERGEPLSHFPPKPRAANKVRCHLSCSLVPRFTVFRTARHTTLRASSHGRAPGGATGAVELAPVVFGSVRSRQRRTRRSGGPSPRERTTASAGSSVTTMYSPTRSPTATSVVSPR